MSQIADASRLHLSARSCHPKIADRATRTRIPVGAPVYLSAATCSSVLLLQSGTIRIAHPSDDRRALYRVKGGEGCILSTPLSNGEALITGPATAETDLCVISMPQRIFDDLMMRSGRFRSAVFRANAHRILDLFRAAEEMATVQIHMNG